MVTHSPPRSAWLCFLGERQWPMRSQSHHGRKANLCGWVCFPLWPLTLASVCVCGGCVRPCTLTPHLVDLCRHSIRFVLFLFSLFLSLKAQHSLLLNSLPCSVSVPLDSFLSPGVCYTSFDHLRTGNANTCARIKTVLLMMLLLVNKRRHQINLCLSLLTTQRYCSSQEHLDSGIHRKPGMCNNDLQQEK